MKDTHTIFTIEPYTRLAWLVWSETHDDVAYVVDLEGFGKQKVVCTCPDFIMGKNKYCKHIRSVAIQI